MPKEAHQTHLSHLSEAQFIAGKTLLFVALFGHSSDGSSVIEQHLSREFLSGKISDKELMSSFELLKIARRIYRKLDK